MESQGNKVICPECSRQFSKKKYLREHIQQKHSENNEFVKKYYCDACGKSYFKKTTLLAHWKKYHAKENRIVDTTVSGPQLRKTLLKCAICSAEMSSIYHYTEQHNIQLSKEHLEFQTEELFQQWKNSIEMSTVCRFIKAYSSGKYVTKFVCHRSGQFKSKGKNIRNIKTQGSKKIGGNCPASIYKKKVGNIIQVEFLSVHVGHENELCHVPTSPLKKKEIKLSQKVPKFDILNSIRGSYAGVDIQHIHVITLKDIANVGNQYSLETEYEEDRNVGVSVDLKIGKLKRSENSHIVYYKNQDLLDNEYRTLKKEDNNYSNEDLFKLYSEVLESIKNDEGRQVFASILKKAKRRVEICGESVSLQATKSDVKEPANEL